MIDYATLLRLADDRLLTEATIAFLTKGLPPGDPFVILIPPNDVLIHMRQVVSSYGLGSVRIAAMWTVRSTASAAEREVLFVPRMDLRVALKVAKTFALPAFILVDHGAVCVVRGNGERDEVGPRLGWDSLCDAMTRLSDGNLAFRALRYLPAGMLDGLAWKRWLHGAIGDAQMRRSLSRNDRGERPDRKEE